MASSVYTETVVRDALLRGVTLQGINTHFLAIWSNGTPESTNGVEVGAVEYTRQAVTFDTNYKNQNRIVFPQAVSSWGDIDYLVVVDQQGTGGNILGWGQASGRTITSGLSVVIEIGDLTVNMT